MDQTFAVLIAVIVAVAVSALLTSVLICRSGDRND